MYEVKMMFLFLIFVSTLVNVNLFVVVSFQSGKSAPYYVGAIQTLPRGMYSDRNKNAIGKYSSAAFLFSFRTLQFFVFWLTSQ